MCDYEGYELGAGYIDSTCIDGYLWDLDSYEGGYLTSGGEMPCPKCNTIKYLDQVKEDVECMVSIHDDNREKLIYEFKKVHDINKPGLHDWKVKNPAVEVMLYSGETASVLTNSVC